MPFAADAATFLSCLTGKTLRRPLSAPPGDEHLSNNVTSYAQGHLRMALDFSELMTAEPATALAAIRDRLFNCGAGGMPAQPIGLPAPFEPMDIQPQPDAASSDAASAPVALPGAASLAATTSGQGVALFLPAAI